MSKSNFPKTSRLNCHQGHEDSPRVYGADEPDSVKEEILRQLKEWRTEKQCRIEELEAENLRLRQNDQAKPIEPVAVDTSTSKPAEVTKKDYSNVTFFTCGQKGHTSVVCCKKSGQKTGPASDDTKAMVPPDQKACDVYGKKGQFFQNCPLKVAQPAVDDKGLEKVDKACSYGTMGRYTTEAYLEIKVNERYYNCLLDTGDVTIFPSTMIKGHKWRPTTTDLKVDNGSPIPQLGETTVRAVWNSRTIWLKCVVTEHMDEVILGLT